ncbi:MAG TPA: protein kinase family protein [Streptosporangiaceae bacterium]|nr:protein kinase family protein [Streptosporangiaceae bacterium]
MSTFTSDPGTRLGGRYRLEDRLAEAGGWSAWRAIDEILARPVSVITFVAGFPRLEQVVTAARAASRLTDTRLTQVFDVEDSWDHGYIVLEWPVGDTLADLLAEGSVEPNAAARIVAEAAAALSGAHAAGLAHLCLRPDAIRWTPGGGVKVTGLGIDAALSGVTADDPELADTRGLGQLLYAALTGLWPGPESPELPSAPQPDGQLTRPSLVRAGVAPALDEVAGRALAVPGLDVQAAYRSPAELAAALSVAIPPVQLPTVAMQRGRREADRMRADWPQGPSRTERWEGQSPRSLPPPPRRSPAKAVAVVALVLVAVAGASAAAVHLLNKSPSPPSAGKSPTAKTSAPSQETVIKPVSASGFDALNPNGDPGDENSNEASNVLDGNSVGWSTQQYIGSPFFGNLKAGTGFILNLGGPVRVMSVTVTFGSVPGANVEIKVGDSGTRSPANLAAMTTVASADDVSGTYTFTVASSVTGQYLVIWFTKLPPMASPPNTYAAQIYSVVVRGSP